MATELGTAYLSIAASTGGLGKDIKKSFGDIEADAGKTGKKSGSAFSGAFKGAIGILGGLAAFGKAADFLRDANAEARESQKVNALTEQIIKATGGAAKVTASQVGDLATSISNATGVDDELIQSSANLLLTFKQVRNEVGKGNQVFDRATLAAQDLAAAGFGDASSTAKMLGKALNDPLKGMNAMSRAGVTFTAAQQEQVKAMVKSGDLLGAQKMILAEVEAQVGGAAEASSTAAEKLATKWGNFKEAIGTAFVLPAVDALAPKLSGVIDVLSAGIEPALALFKSGEKAIRGFFSSMDDGTGILAPVVAALTSIGEGIDFGQLVSAGAQLLGTFSPLSLVFQSLAPILPEVVAAFASLANQALATLVPLVAQLAPIFAQVGATLVGAGTQIASTLLPVLMQLAQAVFPVLLQVISQVAPIVSQLVGALLPIVPLVANLVTSLLPPLAEAITALLPAITPVIGAALDIVKALIPFVSIAVEMISTILPPLAALIAALLPPLVSVVQWIAGQVTEAMQRFASLMTSAAGPIRDFAKAVADKIAEVIDWFAKLPGKITGALDGLPGKLLSLGKDMIQGLINGVKEKVESAINAVKDVGSQIINAANSIFDRHSPSKVFKAIGSDLTNGLALGITATASKAVSAITKVTSLITSTANNATKKQLKSAKKAAKAANKILSAQKVVRASWWSDDEASAATTDRMLKSLTGSGKWKSGVSSALKKATLADFATAREVMAERIKDAQGALNDLISERDGLRNQIAGAIFGEVDLASAMEQGGSWSKHQDAAGNTWYSGSRSSGGFAGIAAHVSALAAKAKTFAGKLKDLIKAGLPGSLVQQIAGMGIDGGTSAASAILSATKTEQGSLVSDWKALESWSDAAGLTVADQMYAVGIAAQQGIVDGLLADDAKLVAAAEALADKLTKAVKKKLGIKSPSRVFRDEVGLMAAKGAAQGLEAGRSLVTKAASSLLGPGAIAQPDAFSGIDGRVVYYAPTYYYPQAVPEALTRNENLAHAAELGGM